MAQNKKGDYVLIMGSKGFDVGCDSVHCVPRIAATGLKTPQATIAKTNVIPFPSKRVVAERLAA